MAIVEGVDPKAGEAEVVINIGIKLIFIVDFDEDIPSMVEEGIDVAAEVIVNGVET